MFIDNYLNYLQEDFIEESKWKRLLAAGKLKKQDLRRIQKAKLPKSKRQWIAGVEKGSVAKVKKSGGRVSNKYHDTALPDYDWAANPGKKLKNPQHSHAKVSPGARASIHVPKRKGGKDQITRAVIKRHEADELRTLMKMQKHKGKRKMIAGRVGFHPTAKSFHASPEVMRREKELATTAAGLYGKKGAKPKKFRIKRGEYKEIPEGGRKATRKIEKQSVAKTQKIMTALRKKDKNIPDKETYKDIIKDREMGSKKVRQKYARYMTGGRIKK